MSISKGSVRINTDNKWFRAAIVLAVIAILAGLGGQAQAHSNLIVGADIDEWLADVKSKIDGTGVLENPISIFPESEAEIPSLDELKRFKSVLLYSGFGFMSSEQLGDNLADYVDMGGGVVMMTISGQPLGGRWISENYDPILQGGTISGGDLTLGDVVRPGHPVMQNVTVFSGGSSSFRTGIGLNGDAKLIAEWSNDEPLVAELDRCRGKVVSLNFWPVSSDKKDGFWDSSTDGTYMMANALRYTGSYPVIPAPSAISLAICGITMLGACKGKRVSLRV